MARLGLLGGTFNPPHVGHVICAGEAAEQLGLQRVLLVPVARPPHKDIPVDPGPPERLALCEAAVAGDDRLGVSGVEVDRGGASYTVDTLRTLNERAPDDELTFIMGGDMALSLPTWREPRAVLELARLAVVDRAGATREDVVHRLDAELPGSAERVRFFTMPRVDVSSTDVRGRLAAGRSVRHLVPPGVADRIAERGLYRAGTGERRG